MKQVSNKALLIILLAVLNVTIQSKAFLKYQGQLYADNI